MKKLEILYEDKLAIIINKPAGLAVQGGNKVKNSIDSILLDMYKTQDNQLRPLLVHRLDKDTSGVLLAAKTKEAAAYFSRLMTGGNERKAFKQYIAVCAGHLKDKEGVIDAEIEVHNKMKKSITKYKVIKESLIMDTEYSVLEIELGTGRMHQIRRHLALAGCPVLGDDKYGDFKLNKKLRQKKLLLHSGRLVVNEANIDVSAPLPSYFSSFM